MKTAWIKIKRGLLTPEHRNKLGKGIWVYLYVLFNDEYTPEDIARHYDMSLALVKKHLRDLAKSGYIEWREEFYKYTRADCVPEFLRWTVWNRDNFQCRKCDSSMCLTIDHIVPQSKGGTTRLENLQTLCRSCNSTKGSR